MVAVHVGTYGNAENAISGHHLLVAMAFQANLGMEFTIDMAVWFAELFNLMQTVAIVAGCRVAIASHNGLAMTGIDIVLMVVMATGTLGYNFCFVTLPIGVGVNVVMTIRAGYFVEFVDT